MSRKCVIAVDDNLPSGLQANIAAVLCLTVGRHFPDVVGETVENADGYRFEGITTIPVPILMASTDALAELVKSARNRDIFHASFTDAALNTKNYGDYTERLASTTEADLCYHGVVLLASDKQVKKLTSGFPLLK